MASPEKRLLVIDEGWLLEHEQSARFVAGLVRRARKYYLGVSIISQQANDISSIVNMVVLSPRKVPCVS